MSCAVPNGSSVCLLCLRWMLIQAQNGHLELLPVDSSSIAIAPAVHTDIVQYSGVSRRSTAVLHEGRISFLESLSISFCSIQQFRNGR